MALIAYRANRGYMNDVVKGVNTERNLPVSQQAGEQNFDLIQGTNLYKVNQLNNTRTLRRWTRSSRCQMWWVNSLANSTITPAHTPA